MLSIKILSTRIDNITLSDALSLTDNFLADGKSHQIITANPLMIFEAHKNDASLKTCPELVSGLKNIFDTAALVIPESAGVHWAAKFLKTPLSEKIPGIDFMIFLMKYAQQKNYSVFFLGAKEEVIKKAADEIKKKFPELKIAGFHNGYFRETGNEQDVISQIKSSGAEILFAGLSTPFQEIWLNKNLEKLGVKIAMGVGGSFDVLSGNLRRAPKWMIDRDIEWIFRVAQQPWRILRIIKLFSFALKILKEKIRLICEKFYV
ncbi:MAG: glycosyltransferase [Elusimicrobia bacterium CG06_land_8_20_14_3_00_38_11]|nr:MAG: glycosyltransferase [Elusimicrobia bacterium CG06_land_8_20_14_3_00_38_11]